MKNFKACLQKLNSIEGYKAFKNSGFFTIVRDRTVVDTKADVLAKLASHFGLEYNLACILSDTASRQIAHI